MRRIIGLAMWITGVVGAAVGGAYHWDPLTIVISVNCALAGLVVAVAPESWW